MRFISFQILSVLFVSTLAQDIKPLFPISVQRDIENPAQVFEEVKDLILSNYYTDQITEKDLYWAGIKGMLRHISPPQNPNLATIWTADEYDKILNSLKGVGVSLGISSKFNTNDGSLTVTSVQENSAADGLILPYDRILRIDGKSLKGLSNIEANNLMKGPLESSVILTVIRDIEILDIELTRTSFKVKNLVVSIIPSTKIAVIEIRKFYLDLNKELERELNDLQGNEIEKIILDLRNNTGGVLNEGVRVANLFLSENNIILRTVTRSNQTPIGASGDVRFDFDMVVLTNGRTASSSEIIVAALQDHKRATVIGSKTYGKGVIETTHTLSNDYRVKFITSAMYSPRGKTWQAKGVLPDFLVEQREKDFNAFRNLPIEDRVNKDIYLITAKKLLN